MINELDDDPGSAIPIVSRYTFESRLSMSKDKICVQEGFGMFGRKIFLFYELTYLSNHILN